jgi:hypothetical protein
VLLIFKAGKYHFQSDVSYKEMTSFLSRNKSWKDKKIFVAGNPDLATYFIMQGQEVQRENAVASRKTQNWFAQYNYVLDVKNTADQDTARNSINKPWLGWKREEIFTTSNHSNQMYIFIR